MNPLNRPFQEYIEAVEALLRSATSAAGVWAHMQEYALLFPAAMCVVWIAFTYLYVFFRERRLPFDRVFVPSIAVVIPAHNEEKVIDLAIRALLDSDYPNLEIHIVSDGSADRTVSIARQYADMGVKVHDLQPNGGKSRALAYALERTSAELFMVVDADTTVHPQAIRYMAQQFTDANIVGVTGNPRVGNVTNLLTAMQAMEYMAIIGMIKRADSFWGGLFSVSGAAACFRTAVLREAGGWSDRSATEDIEMSWRLQKLGYELAFEPRALFQVQAPSGYAALLGQRRRWAQGMAEVQCIHGNLMWTGNTGLIPISFQVIATAAWFILLLANLAAVIVRGLVSPMNAADLSALTTVLLITIGLFLAQTLTAATIDSHHWRGSFRLVPLALLYPLYYWFVIVPSFLWGFSRGLFTRHSGRWARTERTDAAPATAHARRPVGVPHYRRRTFVIR